MKKKNNVLPLVDRQKMERLLDIEYLMTEFAVRLKRRVLAGDEECCIGHLFESEWAKYSKELEDG